jgi:transcriptional regulator with XRE-family HTH domain
MHREAVLQVKKNRKITNVAIAQKTGVSQNHLSAFFRGERNVTNAVLDAIIGAMDELSPGARAEYGRTVAGQCKLPGFEELEEEEFAECLEMLSQAWRRMKLRKAAREDRQLSGVG